MGLMFFGAPRVQRARTVQPAGRPGLARHLLIQQRMMIDCKLAAFATVSLLSLATAACATTGTRTEARLGSPEHQSGQVCRVTAPSQVLASRVFVPGGVNARVEDGRFAIQFAMSKSRCLAVGARSSVGPFTPEEDPSVCAERQDQTAASPSPLRRLGDRDQSADVAPIGDGLFVLAWVEGDQQIHELRAQPVTASGESEGAILALSPGDVSVIGRPSAAILPNGEGLIAFLASNGEGFDAMATPIACAVP